MEGRAVLVRSSLLDWTMFAAVWLIFVGCGGGSASQYTKEDFTIDNTPIPPERCRVVATVVAIDETKRSDRSGDPCSTAPCYAAIRIDSVLGTGRTFNGFLSVGLKVNARFNFTLQKSTHPSLPGMKEGTQFRAEVMATGGNFADIPGPYIVVVDEYVVIRD